MTETATNGAKAKEGNVAYLVAAMGRKVKNHNQIRIRTIEYWIKSSCIVLTNGWV